MLNKLESLENFTALNADELNVVFGGLVADYECSKKYDVDSDSSDSSKDDKPKEVAISL